MSPIQKKTVIFLVIWILVAVVYDIWAVRQGGAPATISWLLSWTSQQWWGASVVFAIGYLMGHLFAQDQPVKL